MKYVINIIVFVISLQIFTVLSYAQQNEDVIYLKNGSIIHGTILEQIHGESVKIKTNDDNLFVFKMSEVLKITSREISPKKDSSDSLKKVTKTDTSKTNVKELIAKNSITIQPLGLILLLANIEYDRSITKELSAGLKITFTTFLLRNGITFTGKQSDVDNAESIKKSLKSFGIGGHIRYYPSNKAIEGFFLGLALESLTGSYDEIKTKYGIKTTNHIEASLVRLEFEIGERYKISNLQGGFTIQWTLGAGAGFWKKDKEKGTVPLGSIGFGLGYSF
jgi:hypothetical protein